jgi:hypothetical protein
MAVCGLANFELIAAEADIVSISSRPSSGDAPDDQIQDTEPQRNFLKPLIYINHKEISFKSIIYF